MTTKKPRTKYRFKTRAEAEAQYHAAHLDSIRNYFAAIHFREPFRTEFEIYRVGSFVAEIIRNHATTGRPLSVGPIVVLDDTDSDCSPTIGDAYNWAHATYFTNHTPSDQSAHDLRELAGKVYQALQQTQTA